MISVPSKQPVTNYQLSLLLHIWVRRTRSEAIAVISDKSNVTMGRGFTRGDAVNSAIKHWINGSNVDTLFVKSNNDILQRYETDLWFDGISWLKKSEEMESPDLKLIHIILDNRRKYIPAFWCEHFNFTKLQNKKAEETAQILADAVEKLGTRGDTDMGVIGTACYCFLSWANENPQAYWQVK